MFALLSVPPVLPSFPRKRESQKAAGLDSRLRGNDGKGATPSRVGLYPLILNLLKDERIQPNRTEPLQP